MHTDSSRPTQTPATPAEAGTYSLGASIVRVLPTLAMLPFNLTPVGGLAVFTGARVKTWLAYALPLAVMVVSDLVLWSFMGDLYSPLHISRPAVYGSFLLYVLLGRCLGGSWTGVGAAALLGSVQFFILTNFASWIELGVLGTTYAPTLQGLLTSFELGLPFYQYTVIGDVAFTFLFFGLHQAWVKAYEPTPVTEASQS